jgi:hypothetical protein
MKQAELKTHAQLSRELKKVRAEIKKSEVRFREWKRTTDFLHKIEKSLLEGRQPKAGPSQILNAYRRATDWRGDLCKIVDEELAKFLNKWGLKWNDNRRLLFFWDCFESINDNPNRFVRVPTSPIIALLVNSENAFILNLKKQEVKKIVRRKIELISLVVESEKRTNARLKYQIKKMLAERNYLPNKKYTEKMFNKTDSFLQTGISFENACRETLKSFGIDEEKWESYQKQYNKRYHSPKK